MLEINKLAQLRTGFTQISEFKRGQLKRRLRNLRIERAKRRIADISDRHVFHCRKRNFFFFFLLHLQF